MLAHASITPDLHEPGLAARLRDETREAHRAVERGPFIRAFLTARRSDIAVIRPTIDRSLYRAYLVALHALYAALEGGLERHREHPVAGPLALPYLYRTSAIAADLRALDERTDGIPPCGRSPRDPASERPVPAARALAEHLHALADRDPALLVAHAYTRYLGDLAGGQLLRGAAANILGASDGRGLAFYEFPGVADLTACKVDLRTRLDALPLAPAQADAVIIEARGAFARNAAIFAELLPP